MIKLAPILLAILYAVAMYRFSVWRTKRNLDSRSSELADARLMALTDRMAAALDLARVRVHLYEVPAVNGLAAPDGRIFITRGFYEKYRQGAVSAEEMASVIAHELGHVALGHSKRRMIDFSGQNALRTALAMVLSRFVPGLGAWIASGIASLLAARLSRQDEHEADAYASALLARSGIGTGAQKSLLSKLEGLAGGGKSMPAWLMSHPKTAERIAGIEAREARWGLSE